MVDEMGEVSFNGAGGLKKAFLSSCVDLWEKKKKNFRQLEGFRAKLAK